MPAAAIATWHDHDWQSVHSVLVLFRDAPVSSVMPLECIVDFVPSKA